MAKKQKSLSTAKLALFSIGTTLGSGVFSMVGDFAISGAHQLAILIGWVICGLGMLGLTLCFFRLALVKPELTDGIYTYAKEGFGEYLGFNSAWGYWLSAMLAQLSYATLLFNVLGNFFPIFGNGSNLISIICSSAIVWGLSYLIYRGVNEAVGINAVVVIAKSVPILVMMVGIIFAGAFKWDIFLHNMTGASSGVSVFEQLKSTVYTTVWIFIGIEGAVVLSGRGKTTKVAGNAVIISFISLFILYFLISVLSMGVMTQEELAGLSNPAMAGVLEHVVGRWGSIFVNIAVLLSVGGSMFSYTILCVDSAYGPAKYESFPEGMRKLNKYRAPTYSILASALFIQTFLILIYFNEATYQAVYAMSTSAIMVPYVFSAFYYLKLVAKGEGLEGSEDNKTKTWIIAILGSTYGAWLLYSSGLTYMLVATMLYAPGTLVYLYNRKKRNKPLFETKRDLVFCIFMMVALIFAIVLTANGTIEPF